MCKVRKNNLYSLGLCEEHPSISIDDLLLPKTLATRQRSRSFRDISASSSSSEVLAKSMPVESQQHKMGFNQCFLGAFL